jgi:single-stranded-DNA-specific exonuclease
VINQAALRFRPAPREKLDAILQGDPTLSPLIARMLVARGYDTPAKVQVFFNPTAEALHDPLQLKGMTEAVELLREGLAQGQRILIHGDYDCDGVCGTTLLMEALQEVGADVGYHLPDRFQEGYGLSMLAVERCKQEGFGLLVSVDCGSSSHLEIEAAKAAGIKVIVTDHHTVPQEPPQPHAFVNPQQAGCPYPFKGICGTGVAFKLIQALRGQSGLQPDHFLDLVALATVADVVPLIDENRVLVQFGLQEVGRSRREGLTALMEVAGRSGRDVVDAFTVGFTLGPRLNAAGRMEHARAGVELLMSRSLTEARQLATHLDNLNEERKECERRIQEEIEIRLRSDPQRYRSGAIVEWGEGWHEGVIGITAGRLAEKYGVPTLVIATDGERAKGSGRSPENVDLYQALRACERLFQKYGGHPRAGGFSLHSQHLPELREEMARVSNDLRDGLAPVWLDGTVTLAQADIDLVKELERMEPFGEKNPKPAFLMEGVDVVHQRLVGKAAEHLQLEIEQVGQRRRAIAFRQADLVGDLKTQEYRYDLRCELGRDTYKGQEQLRLQVLGVVQPPSHEVATDSVAVVDLRHLRGRRKALEEWLGGADRRTAICRQPDKAVLSYPDYPEQFYTYHTCPAVESGLVLLTPPDSLQSLDELLDRVHPSHLVVLFGCAEVERSVATLVAQRWSRDMAIRFWQLLKSGRVEPLTRASAERVAQDRLKLQPDTTREILSAFTETGAVRSDETTGGLTFGQANGTKLEDTRAFLQWRERVRKMEEVRAFFSGPDLAWRMGQRWPWLAASSRVPEPLSVR